jgi:hypothetical protein
MIFYNNSIINFKNSFFKCPLVLDTTLQFNKIKTSFIDIHSYLEYVFDYHFSNTQKYNKKSNFLLFTLNF